MSCTDSSFSTASDAGDSQSSVSCLESSGGAPILDFAGLSINDEQAVDVKTDAAGAYSIVDTNTSGGKGFSPSNEPYRPPFVIQGSHADSDDVFRSTPRRSSNQRTPTGPKSNRGVMSGNWRSDSNSDGSDADISSPSREKVQRDAKRNGQTPGSGGRHSTSPPGNHNSYEVITDDDAQARFPPSCCVFVANLLQSETEEALQAAVTKVFSDYGIVFVKIRRDNKQMPFAFCQYTSVRDAERAIRDGRGRLINGRPCRTEKAKAHRIFLVERKFGPVVTPEEVRKLMYHYGTISSCHTASNVERAALNLNEGVIVEFEMYDEGQAAFAAFRGHELFKVSPVSGMATPPRSDSANRAYLDRYHADRSSIFVGNLPSGITEEKLRELFEPYGPIVDISIRVAPSRFEVDENICFAFIEYRSWDSVTRVLGSKATFSLNGKPLRVSQKGVQQPRRNRVQDESPARHRPEQPTSPVAASPMAPQSPPQYGFYGYSPMSYPPSAPATLYTDGQGQYYTTYPSPHTSPSYYSPSFAATSPAHQAYWAQAQAHAQTQASPYYWGGYPAAPSYGSYSPAGQQQTSPPNYNYQPASGPVNDASHEDRTSTPTPPGHAESDIDSQ